MLPFLLAAQELDTVSTEDFAAYADSSVQEETDYQDSTTAGLESPYSEQEVRTHSLWDQSVPVNVDSTEEWWINGGLVERKVPEKVLSKLKSDKDLQYDKKEAPKNRNEWPMKVMMAIIAFLYQIRLLIVILLIAGLVLLIIYFMRQQGFRFSGKNGDEMPDVEEIDTGVSGYEKQVQEAIAGGQFRQAVRFLHLQTLRLMADRELIVLSKDKTNADYLRVLLKTPWYQPFARLTRDYEYIWYGHVNVNAEQFGRIHGQFRQFITELGFTR
jgi:hypothetical protein